MSFDKDRDGAAAGFDYHFTKPADPAALDRVLRDIRRAHPSGEG